VSRPFHRNFGITAVAVFASSATLVCCVLPAMLVTLGAGAALVGLVTAVPQLIWLSEHKMLVFGLAAILLFVSGAVLWHARRLPCPSDPAAARACTRLRSVSHRLFALAVAMLALGALFAFALPL
jgi:uncharacterized iron-regulated membrane protein